jgi:hypothetical protein
MSVRARVLLSFLALGAGAAAAVVVILLVRSVFA